jgi:hypothetical protein
VIVAPAWVFVGCCRNWRLVAGRGVIENAALVAPVRPLALAARV